MKPFTITIIFLAVATLLTSFYYPEKAVEQADETVEQEWHRNQTEEIQYGKPADFSYCSKSFL